MFYNMSFQELSSTYESMYVKITAGLSIETDFRKLVKHIHRQEGFQKLTNMIMCSFRGMICIKRPNSKESTFSHFHL